MKSSVTTDNQSELFIVVDENDTIVGYRTRYDCHHNPTLIHRTVGVAVFDSLGRVLLQKRSQTKDMDPGTWGMSSAGHVLKGEEYTDAAERELKEELGVSIPLAGGVHFLTRTTQETEMAMLYTASYDGPFYPDAVETDGVEFFTKDAVRGMIDPGTDSIIMKGTIDGLHQLGWI